MSKIKDISKIKIKSKIFTNSEILLQFPEVSSKTSKKKPEKINSTTNTNNIILLYGENGSGKTTIANGFRKIKDNQSESKIDISLFSENDKNLSFSEEESKEFFIFDEKYIKEKIYVESGALKTIILFGKQIEFEREIKDNAEEIAKNNGILEDFKRDMNSRFVGTDKITSPDYWHSKIKEELKFDEGWAQRKSQINFSKNKSPVSDNVINEIMKSEPNPEFHIKDIKDKFQELLKTYKDIYKDIDPNKESQEILEKVHLITIKKNLEEEFKSLLKTTTHLKIMKDDEKELFNKVFDNKIENLKNAKSYLSSSENSLCWTCLQTISDKQRQLALSTINKVLNSISDSESKDIKDLTQELTEIDCKKYSKFEIIDKNISDDIVSKIQEYNRIINNYKDLIIKKNNEPFYKFSDDDFKDCKSISVIVDKLNELLKTLEDKRKNYNRIVKDKQSSKKDLEKLNNELAYLQIYEMHKQYEKYKNKKTELNKKINFIESSLEELKTKRKNINGKRENIKIAIEKINQSLKEIFFGNRLQLVLDDKSYCIKLNGKDIIKSLDLSTGERNILALCYFFTEIAEYQNEGDEFNRDIFLVIDDPLSSLDFNNRMGILGFLIGKFNEIFEGSKNSKILLMSHDLKVIFYLQDSKKINQKRIFFELCNGTAISRNTKKFKNQYTILFNNIFNYAFSNEYKKEELCIATIGNAMRRVAEAFFTFSYKLDIEDIFKKDNNFIISNLENAEYYKNKIPKLMLNYESHFEQHSKFGQNMDFPPNLDESEMKKMAGALICLIHELNPHHVYKQLSNPNEEVNKKINEWKNNISKN